MTAAPRRGSMRDKALKQSGQQSLFDAPSSQPEHPPQQPKRRGPRDETVAPAGYDQNYWGMAVLFRDRAMKDDINLRAGVPVIYGEIRRVCEWFDLEHGSRPFQTKGDGTTEKTFAQVYRDGTGKQLTWVEVGYAIIEEFWCRVWDDAALSHFCDMDVFMFIARYVCEGWSGQRMRAHFKAHPPPTPDIETWNREGHRRRRTRVI